MTSDFTTEYTEYTEKNIGDRGGKLRMFKRDELTHRIIGAAMEVHSKLGPGLLESVYESALCIELNERNMPYEQQKRISVSYKGRQVGELYADLIVDDRVILELKSVRELAPIHEAQLIAYLKLAGIKTGLLINFNVVSLKSGVKRFSV